MPNWVNSVAEEPLTKKQLSNYINEGNRFYNEELQLHFGQYIVDLKTSLERKK